MIDIPKRLCAILLRRVAADQFKNGGGRSGPIPSEKSGRQTRHLFSDAARVL